MPRSSNAVDALPPTVLAELSRLGRFIAGERAARGLSQQKLAERMFVSRQTLHRLESGDPAVGLAVLASALFALGKTKRLRMLSAAEETLNPGASARRSRAADRDLDF
jgi:transcriptional regulator with XRE-family HTH domain